MELCYLNCSLFKVNFIQSNQSWSMENTTNAQKVMGPGVPRVKVSTFNGQQNFANWQNQMSKSYIATQMDSMTPNCLQTVQDLQA